MSKHAAGHRVLVRKDASVFGPGTVEEALEGCAVYKVLLDSGGTCMCPADWVLPLPPDKDPLPAHVREAHEAARRTREEAVRKAREEATGWNFKVGDRVEFWVATWNPRKFGPGTVHGVLVDARYRVRLDNGRDAVIGDENLKPLPRDRDPLAKRSRKPLVPQEGLLVKDAVDNDATASSELSTSSNSRAGSPHNQGSTTNQAEAAEMRRLERPRDGKPADRDNRGVTFAASELWLSEHSQQETGTARESTVDAEPADAEESLGLGAGTLEADPTDGEPLDLDAEVERCLVQRQELAEEADGVAHCVCSYWCFGPTSEPRDL